MTTIRADLRNTATEVREFIAAHETETRVWIFVVWVCVSLAVVTPSLWPWAIFADTVAAAMGLGAWCWSLRVRLAKTRGRLEATELLLTERGEELKHADTLITRLAGENSYLSGQVLAEKTKVFDLEARRVERGVVGEPVRLRVVPEQPEGEHDSLAALDAEATEYTWPAIARDAWLDEITKPEGWL